MAEIARQGRAGEDATAVGGTQRVGEDLLEAAAAMERGRSGGYRASRGGMGAAGGGAPPARGPDSRRAGVEPAAPRVVCRVASRCAEGWRRRRRSGAVGGGE